MTSSSWLPTIAPDSETCKQFVATLERVVPMLFDIDEDPVLIAECPNKYNDSGEDDLWMAAQCGEAYWERSLFFELSPENVANDRSNKADLDGLQRTRTVLWHARRWNWAHWAGQLSGGPLACLAAQHGQLLICKTNPIDGEGNAWTWSKERGLVHLATCDRIDQSIGELRPIVLRLLREDFWTCLTAEARAYFRPACTNEAANRALGQALDIATDQTRLITSERTALVSSDSYVQKADIFDDGWRKPWVHVGNDSCLSTIVSPLEDRRRKPKFDNPYAVHALSDVVGQLEDGKWRSLFATAFGNLREGDQLILMVTPARAQLIWEHSVFEVQDGLLKFRGLTDRADLYDREWFPSMHPATD